MLEVITIKEARLKIGEWCKQKRQKFELSQEELAQALELSRLTIRKLEEGHNATLDTLLKVVNHFDMLGELYTAIDKNISDNNISSLY